ncbi:MAG: OadG family protein [Opitutales bacterium]
MAASDFPSSAALLASTGEDLLLVLLGFGIVLLILGTLWLITSLVGRIFIAQEKRRLAEVPPPPEYDSAPEPLLIAPLVDPIPDAHLIALAAVAAQIALNRPVAIRSITPASRGNWAAEGRRDIHSSHRVR